MDQAPVSSTTDHEAALSDEAVASMPSPVVPAAASTKPATKKKPGVKRVVDKGEQRPYMQVSLADDARPVDRVAFEVLALRSDLLPSVERIIHGCPDEATAEHALLLFQQSLSAGADPNRNPQVAIAAAVQARGAA